MRYLADAPALVGFVTGAADFPHRLRTILEEETPLVGVTAPTLFRITRLVAAERLPSLRGPDDASLAAMLRSQGFQLPTLDAETAEQAANLTAPADLSARVLVATAQRTGAVILTNGPSIAACGVPCLWADG